MSQIVNGEEGFTATETTFLPWARINWGNGPADPKCDHVLRTKVYSNDGCADQKCVKCGQHFEYAGDYS